MPPAFPGQREAGEGGIHGCHFGARRAGAGGEHDGARAGALRRTLSRSFPVELHALQGRGRGGGRREQGSGPSGVPGAAWGCWFLSEVVFPETRPGPPPPGWCLGSPVVRRLGCIPEGLAAATCSFQGAGWGTCAFSPREFRQLRALLTGCACHPRPEPGSSPPQDPPAPGLWVMVIFRSPSSLVTFPPKIKHL